LSSKIEGSAHRIIAILISEAEFSIYGSQRDFTPVRTQNIPAVQAGCRATGGRRIFAHDCCIGGTNAELEVSNRWEESSMKWRRLTAGFAAAMLSLSPGAAQSSAVLLDSAERRRVVDAVIAHLKQYSADPAAASRISGTLLAHEAQGDYNAPADAEAFAQLLTSQLREATHDPNKVVIYSRDPLPNRPPGPARTEVSEQYRRLMEQRNCTFEKVGILPHNIGYLKIDSFPHLSVCQTTATAAMAALNSADAIIFGLRDDGGGYPETVSWMAAYPFDHPEYWFSPREDTTERSWTRSPVAGNRLSDKPVFILTSSRTMSGAEQFSYDLKMLKRATLVGETTRGAEHAGEFHRIDDHFGMGITEVQAINPFSPKGWEGIGAEPDVKVSAAEALAKARALAEDRLRTSRQQFRVR
jgi:hypothetical protein